MTAAQTRDCLDPWEVAYVSATGDVALCCWSKRVAGNLGEQTLDQILEGESARTLRRELLTGELDIDCQRCPMRGETTTEQLEQCVRALDGVDIQPESFATRRRLRRFAEQRVELLDRVRDQDSSIEDLCTQVAELRACLGLSEGEEHPLRVELDVVQADRASLRRYLGDLRSSPRRLLVAFARACLRPLLGKAAGPWSKDN